jgi:hypothetical protein
MPIDPRDVSTTYPFGYIETATRRQISFSLRRFQDGRQYIDVFICEPGAVLERMAYASLDPSEWAQFVAIVDECSDRLGVTASAQIVRAELVERPVQRNLEMGQ